MNPTEFLRARIAEDERAADLVLRPYGDHAPSNDAAWWRSEREWFKSGLSSDETPLLTLMHPQRVLAECEAKRRILDGHPRTGSLLLLGYEECGTCTEDAGEDIDATAEPVSWPCLTIKALALLYEGHPDYDESWRP